MKGDGEEQEEKAAFTPLVSTIGIHEQAQCYLIFYNNSNLEKNKIITKKIYTWNKDWGCHKL